MPVTLIGVSSAHGEDSGLASGLFNTAQQVGGALGLAILATIAASHTSSIVAGLGSHPGTHALAGATVSGYRIAFIVAAGFMMLSILILVVFLRPRHLEELAVEGELAPAVSA